MKLTTMFVLACLVSMPAFCGIPPKSEMAVSGTFVRPKTGGNVYAFDGQLAVPINEGGNLLVGPKLHYDSDDAKNAIGVVLEVNFLGTSKSGPYLGANGLYNVKDVAGTERYTVDGVAGLKLQIGPGGFVKVFASKPVAGREKDNSDITGNVGIGIRF